MPFTIRDNFADMQRHVRSHGTSAESAGRRATKQTLIAIEQAQTQEMRRVFRAPVAYTLRALRIWNPTRASTEGRIVIRSKQDISSAAVTPEHYLRAEIDGGARVQKRSERALQRAGVLPAGWLTVPAKGARLDANGNMSRGQITEILSWFAAFPEKGYRKNSTIGSKAKKVKGTKSRHGQRYFAVQPGARGLKPGIYHAQVAGRAMGPVAQPQMVLVFVRRANYTKRYDFGGVSDRVAKAVHPAAYQRAMQKPKDANA